MKIFNNTNWNLDKTNEIANNNNNEESNNEPKIEPIIIPKESKSIKIYCDKKSEAQSRDFDETWLKTNTWLRYDGETGLMTCQTCIDFGKTNIFTRGCDRKRRDVLNEHINLESHKEAIIDSISSKKSKTLFNSLLLKNEEKNFILLKFSNFIAMQDHLYPSKPFLNYAI